MSNYNQYIAIAIPIIIAFVISAVLGPIIIPFLRKLKFGQTVRDDGPDQCYFDVLYLCEGLSTDHSNPVCDCRIRCDWIFR